MKTIFKTPLRPGVTFHEFTLPPGAKPLCLQVQERVPTVWWLVDRRTAKMMVDSELSEKDFLRMENYRVVVVGTGHDVEDRWQYLGTWQETVFVWHAFLVP